MKIEINIREFTDSLFEPCPYENHNKSLVCIGGTLLEAWEGYRDSLEPCPQCHGQGRVLSEDGRYFVDTLKGYL